jgi:glycosyltransferase involved in cell wall biosynthesis
MNNGVLKVEHDGVASTPSIFVVGARGIPNIEGGAEKNAEALFPRVVSLGYHVHLMGLSTFVKNGNYRGVNLYKAPHYALVKTDKIAYYLFAIRHIFRIKPDIVHLQGLGSAIFLFVYKILGYKVVVRYGSADYILDKWGTLGRLGFLFSEWQLRFADAVISVAPALSERLAGRGIVSNVHTIPNAIDDAVLPENGTQDSPPYFIMVGRVTAQKNILKLIEAFKIFVANRPDVELCIVGGLDDGEYCRHVQAALSPNIKLLGRIPRDEVPGLLMGAKAFINISLHEGSSNATLEALSHGKPLIVSDIPENRDMELPENVYVDPDDAFAIAATMEQLMEDQERFVVDTSQFLTWDRVAEKTVEIYRAILARPF